MALEIVLVGVDAQALFLLLTIVVLFAANVVLLVGGR